MNYERRLQNHYQELSRQDRLGLLDDSWKVSMDLFIDELRELVEECSDDTNPSSFTPAQPIHP